MMDVNQGFSGRLKAVAPWCRIIHCFIHQALAAKKLSKNLNDVLLTCMKVVNLLKSRPLNSRLFAELCVDEAHQTLLLHTKARWLSRGRVLRKEFELYGKIQDIMMQLHSDYLRNFESLEFLFRLAYLSDIFGHFNSVNVKL